MSAVSGLCWVGVLVVVGCVVAFWCFGVLIWACFVLCVLFGLLCWCFGVGVWVWVGGVAWLV